MEEIPVVKLSKKEQALENEICWDMVELTKRDDRLDHLEKMGELAELLFERNAIPKVRLAYFTDPKMNVGGHGKSRKQVFEQNGTSGRDLRRHPHYMAYLRYFIYGPDLPKETIRGFCKIIEDDAGTSGMVLKQIRAFVRKEVRDKKLDAGHAADEFFKLAHEIDKASLAESVRSAAKSA
ncbi:MAG: hypothetical protein L0Y70_26080 [Gemmataceae bacterium]|nr:hypothetical protein [Gemmataceae bacterium]